MDGTAIDGLSAAAPNIIAGYIHAEAGQVLATERNVIGGEDQIREVIAAAENVRPPAQ